MSEHYTNLVKECIFCFEQCTSEKYDEDMHKAARYESCIYELFNLMTDDELDCYRAKLVELGHVEPEVYKNAERFVTAKK